MRFQIVLTYNLALALESLAKRDHRPVRLEAEWLLSRAIEQALRAQEGAEPEQTDEATHATPA